MGERVTENARISEASARRDGLADVSADSLADLVSDAIFTFDSRWRVQSVNRAFRECFCSATGEIRRDATFCEIADCRYAGEGVNCGASAACAFCGWPLAAAAAIRGVSSEHECRILTRAGHAYDLSLRTARAKEGSLCCVKDLYEVKRLRVLERTFFHDVMNHAVGIKGLSDWADVNDPAQVSEYMGLMQNCASRMVDAILWLRTLRGAEQGSLSVCVSPITADELIDEVVSRCRDEADSRHVEIERTCESGWAVETDRELARLVLGCLALNAVESCKRGDRVGLSVKKNGLSAEFLISNPSALTTEVRSQVFQRSFSTKGAGRGVGTYGAKLVAERYLNGTVWFETRSDASVVFGVAVPLLWPQGN